MINAEIFREYDIRGIADRDLNSEATTDLGKGIGTFLKQHGCQRIAVGRDCRLSSDRLSQELTAGILSTGLNVLDIGVCPTPLTYFAHYHSATDGSVMVTGSHNPPEYNGFKVGLGKTTLYGQQIQEVRQLIEEGRFSVGEGSLESTRLEGAYIEEIFSRIGSIHGAPKVIVDCGNGTASIVAPELYRKMGARVVELFCELDGRFPNHHPDPTVPENLRDLIESVRSQEADLGIAFDGDGDRIGVVDDQGNIIWGDQLMIVFGRQILGEQPGATIIGDVKCSNVLFDAIEKAGGRPIMWKTGHSLIKAKLKEEQALLAGEMSGHLFFADRYYGYDDATYAGARLIQIMAETGKKIPELLEGVPGMHNTPEIRLECSESAKFEIVRLATDFFSKEYAVNTIDGVRILFDDGWGLMRASNTQPVIVLRFEAETPERLREIQSLVESKLADFRQTAEP